MVTVVLADDHAIVRQGLRTLLESNPLFEVVGEAADGREALALVKRRKPAVLIADLMMPGVNGLQLTSNVTRLKVKTKVIVLSMYRDDAYVLEAFRNGAAGYVAKESGGADLFQAIETTLAGRRYLSPAISETSRNSYAFQGSALRTPQTSSPDRFATLTPRERLELRLVAEGASRRDIATRLKVGLRTVVARRISLMRKLGLNGRGALLRYALHRGVLPPSSTARRLRGLAAAEVV
jgi:two-component system, NarL family, response regulator NreC